MSAEEMSGQVAVEECVRPSMKERQRQLREDAILDAAIELMNTKGFNSMTLEDITEAIGISRPTLYQHFRSKEDVVMHISLRCRRQALDFLASQDRTRSARDRMIEFCDWILDLRFGPKKLPFTDMMQVISAQECLNSQLAEVEACFLRDFTALIEEGQREGTVRTDLTSFMV